ncbi:flagellar hook-length control protein FliK [Bacteroidetes/Chlorobi group bacterium Naka2016]|jgi:flagellar hook-length control protein FliK|nr:MAG: flagellar hook-length control protein FliK [Bacteroidetes/Chlorobi group bacterium Naka2016]
MIARMQILICDNIEQIGSRKTDQKSKLNQSNVQFHSFGDLLSQILFSILQKNYSKNTSENSTLSQMEEKYANNYNKVLVEKCIPNDNLVQDEMSSKFPTTDKPKGNHQNYSNSNIKINVFYPQNSEEPHNEIAKFFPVNEETLNTLKLTTKGKVKNKNFDLSLLDSKKELYFQQLEKVIENDTFKNVSTNENKIQHNENLIKSKVDGSNISENKIQHNENLIKSKVDGSNISENKIQHNENLIKSKVDGSNISENKIQHNEKTKHSFVDNSTNKEEKETKLNIKNNHKEIYLGNINHQKSELSKIVEEFVTTNQKANPLRLSDLPSKVVSLVQNAKEFPIKAEISLQPKWLGTLVVEISVVNDKVEIMFKSENKETLHTLENKVSILKEKLNNNGFEKHSLVFNYQNEEKGASEWNFARGNNRQQDENLRREFLNSFTRLKTKNESFENYLWLSNGSQH